MTVLIITKEVHVKGHNTIPGTKSGGLAFRMAKPKHTSFHASYAAVDDVEILICLAEPNAFSRIDIIIHVIGKYRLR